MLKVGASNVRLRTELRVAGDECEAPWADRRPRRHPNGELPIQLNPVEVSRLGGESRDQLLLLTPGDRDLERAIDARSHVMRIERGRSQFEAIPES